MEQKHNVAISTLYFGLILVLCSAVFSNIVVPINSHDLWWHLATGNYILDKGELPREDPFTFTASRFDSESPGRVSFVLKQYWLAQVSYAAVHRLGGEKGLIIFRGLLFVGLALMLFSLSPKPRGWLIPFPLFVLASRIAVEDSDRPHLFAFIAP